MAALPSRLRLVFAAGGVWPSLKRILPLFSPRSPRPLMASARLVAATTIQMPLRQFLWRCAAEAARARWLKTPRSFLPRSPARKKTPDPPINIFRTPRPLRSGSFLWIVVVTCAVVRLGSRIQHVLPESHPKTSPPQQNYYKSRQASLPPVSPTLSRG